MSGGVDSSVAAALLVEQGYEVVGVTMQVWDYSSCNVEEGIGTCCSSLDVDDARAVAERLEIPFFVINCEKPFRTHVVEPFLKSYLKGETPSPCVHCNTFLKFDLLVQKMMELDCEFLATGHYVQKIPNGDRLGLKVSEDGWKDQSYFLFTLKPQILDRLLFPVGGMTKEQVRLLAERFGLVTARKKDSTGICFVGALGHGHFIEKELPDRVQKRGQVRHYPTGRVVGHHEGVHHYTYGQRKGLGICGQEPQYVLKIDAENDEVWIGEERHLFSGEMHLEKLNLFRPIAKGEKLRIKIRFRHQGAMASVYCNPADLTAQVYFDEPQRAITPGQAAVFYQDRELVGGGWIR